MGISKDVRLITAAEALADHLYFGFTDKLGEPLIEHCTRVALVVNEQGHDAEVIAAAVLHDCAESPVLESRAPHPVITAMGLDHFQKRIIVGIQYLVSRQTSRLVEVVSRLPGENYMDYIRRIKDSGVHGAVAIKIADLKDNLREPVPGNLRERYLAALEILEARREKP